MLALLALASNGFGCPHFLLDRFYCCFLSSAGIFFIIFLFLLTLCVEWSLNPFLLALFLRPDAEKRVEFVFSLVG